MSKIKLKLLIEVLEPYRHYISNTSEKFIIIQIETTQNLPAPIMTTIGFKQMTLFGC